MFQNLLEIKPQKDLPRHQCKSTQNAPTSNLAIDQHLFDNKIGAEKFNINWFSILATGHSSFHLATLKTTFIESLEPSLSPERIYLWIKAFLLAMQVSA